MSGYERVLLKLSGEVFGGGRSAVVDDWRRLALFGKKERRVKRWRRGAQKGHLEELQAFSRAITRGDAELPDLGDYATTMAATFAIGQSLSLRDSVAIRLTPDVTEKDAR